MKNAKWTRGRIVVLSLLGGLTSKSTKNMLTFILHFHIAALRNRPVRSSGRKVVYLSTSITEKAPKASTAQRDQTALKKEQHYRLMTAAQASNWLHHSHFCQAWQYTQYIVGSWRKRETVLPLLLILWHCFPVFLICDIHLWEGICCWWIWRASVTSSVLSLSFLSNKNHHRHMTLCPISKISPCS